MTEYIIEDVKFYVEEESQGGVAVLSVLLIPYQKGVDMSCYTNVDITGDASLEPHVDSPCVYSRVYNKTYKTARSIRQRATNMRISCRECTFALSSADMIKINIIVEIRNEMTREECRELVQSVLRKVNKKLNVNVTNCSLIFKKTETV